MSQRAGRTRLRRVILSTTAVTALVYGMSGHGGWSQDLVIDDTTTPNPTVFSSDGTFDTITVENAGSATTSGAFVLDPNVTLTSTGALVLNSSATHSVEDSETLNAGSAVIKTDLAIGSNGVFAVTNNLETQGDFDTGGTVTAGSLSVADGTFDVTGAGDVTVAGATTIGAAAVNNAGTLETGSLLIDDASGSFGNTGTTTVTEDLTDETDGNTLTNSGTLTVGGDVTVTGTVQQTGAGTLDVTGGADIGVLNISGTSSLTSDANVTLGALYAGTDTAVSGATVTLTGNGMLGGKITGDLTVTDIAEDGVRLSVGTGGMIEDDLTISATPTAATDGVVFTNTSIVGGNVTVGSDSADSSNLSFVNSGTVSGDIISYGTVRTEGGVSGDITANDGRLEFAPGATVGGAVTVSEPAVLYLGTYGNVGGGAVQITGDLLANGAISSTGDNSMSVGGTFTSFDTIEADGGVTTISATTINLRDGTIRSEVNGGTLSFAADTINYGIDTTIPDAELAYDLGVIDGATVTIDSAIDGAGYDLAVSDGTLDVNADFTGLAVTTVSSDGVINLAAETELEYTTLTNDGTIRMGAGSTLTGTGNTYTNNSVTLVGDGGTIQDAGAIINNGTLTFLGNATLDSDTDTSGGEIITNTGTLALTTTANAAPVVSALDDVLSTGSSAEITLAQDTTFNVSGMLTNTSGATVAIGTDATMSATDTVVNTDGASITVASGGSLSATNGITNEDTATLDVNGGTVSGTLDNSSTVTFAGTMTGDVNNTGSFTFDGDSMMSGDFDNFAAGTFTIDGDSTVDGALNNEGLLRNGGSGMTLTVTDGVTNTGTIRVLDMFTIDTASVANAGGRIDLGTDDAADDVLMLTGTVAGGTLAFDIDLGDSTGATDQIILSSLTGNVQLEFDTLASGAILDDPLQVVAGNAVSATLTSSGLPARSGPLSYQVTQSSDGVFVDSVIDPGAAAVSGNLALVQSLIGTIVNRPSSPFVSGLAYESEDTCGSGAWVRGTGGRAEATSHTDNGQARLPATVDADFYGFVTGYDFGCFNSAAGEWDVAAGGLLGINSGSTEQKVFELGVSGSDIVLTNTQVSTTRSDFDQRYVGGYIAAARGAFTGDVQLRFENTDYVFDNESLGLYDEETSSNGTTLSASLSYSHALSDTLTLVPTAGFGITRTSTDDLVFRDNSGSEIGRIDFDDHTTKIGFVGSTLAHTTIAPSGTEAYNSFVTATYYEDFSDDMTSKYRIGNDSQDLTTDPLGGFGELSVGLSYIKILDGEVGAAKQFNASVRADARFSDDVEAFSITAQARLQF
jgi:hypothetical protein